jgi:hypothetical protein
MCRAVSPIFVIAALVATTGWACAPSIPGEIDGNRLPSRTKGGEVDSDASSDASADGAASSSSNNNNNNGNGNGNGNGNNNPANPDAGTTDSGGGTTTPPPPPAPTIPCGQLGNGIDTLKQNQSVVSCDKRFTLIMQGDGNLVLYKNGVGALWSSNTYGTGADHAVMQGDGNFVVYDAANQPHFHTSTFGHPGASLAVQNDGNVVVYDGPTPLWASNTAGN